MQKPALKPQNPLFSSGPTTKPKGFHIGQLSNALLGRSHRSVAGKARLKQVVDLTRALLNVPQDYKIAITPGGDTGAFELALWHMLGLKPVDMIITDVFGRIWAKDLEELGLEDVRVFEAPFGEMPDLKEMNQENDVVCVWNGTTSSLLLHEDMFSEKRGGLVFCDATSGAFATPLPFEKLDVITLSWQKVLGGEGGHGMLIVSPRAIERLKTYKPNRPLPRLFRLMNKTGFNEAFFEEATLNTPSMLCVEDCKEALLWAQKQGGLYEKAQRNAAIFYDFLDASPVFRAVVSNQKYRSPTVVCFDFKEDFYQSLDKSKKWEAVRFFVNLLEKEGAAYDIAGHAFDEPCIRFWVGPTVEGEDLEKVLPWLTWAYENVLLSHK